MHASENCLAGKPEFTRLPRPVCERFRLTVGEPARACVLRITHCSNFPNY